MTAGHFRELVWPELVRMRDEGLIGGWGLTSPAIPTCTWTCSATTRRPTGSSAWPTR